MPAAAVHVQKSQYTWGPRGEVKMRKLVLEWGTVHKAYPVL